jgi:hypothetical protein
MDLTSCDGQITETVHSVKQRLSLQYLNAWSTFQTLLR